MLSAWPLLVGPVLLVAMVLVLLAGPSQFRRLPSPSPDAVPEPQVWVSGQIMRFNRLEQHYHPVGARVAALAGQRLLGAGNVDEDHRFAFPIPASYRGSVELRIDRHGAAPALVEADGHDLADVVVLYNPVNNWLA